jgi:hemoglobin-like flavoprotein
MNALFSKISAKRQSVVETLRLALTKAFSISKGPVSKEVAALDATSPNLPAKKDALDTIPEKYRGSTLTNEQKSLITASVPALQAHGFDITKLFYTNLTENYPVVKNIFNETNQVTLEQPKALAGAVLAYAENIHDLTPLLPTVELIANKHASLYVAPELYAAVGTELISAIASVLGDAVTPELAEAWTAAYWQLAEIFIRREDAIYKASGGWTTWKDFRIAKKIKESDEITSFHLVPVDASMKPLPVYKPGQVSQFLACLKHAILNKAVHFHSSRGAIARIYAN